MRRPGQALGDDGGVALLLALASVLLVTTIGIGVVLATMAEGLIAGGYRAGHETFYGAEAALEWGVRELERRSAWALLPGEARPVVFGGNPSVRVAPVEIAGATAVLQRAADAVHGTGARRRVWRPLGHGWLSGLAHVDGSALYVAVWVADDPSDPDGDPLRDGNGVLLLHAEAFGPRDARRTVEAVVAAGGRIVSWFEPRDGT